MLSQLDCRIFGHETIKEQYVFDADFKDVLLHCREGKTWNKFFDSMIGSCLELTSYVFQLDPFVFCCYRRPIEVV
jgi:hypothetical protein